MIRQQTNFTFFLLALIMLGSLLFSETARATATDMRQVRIEARAAEAAMKKRAAEELQAAREAAAQSRKEITEDREKLDRAIADLARRAGELKTKIKALKETNERLAGEDKTLTEKVAQSRGMVKELSGVIRMNAKDIRTLLDASFLSGVYHPDTSFLKGIADKSVFPGMAHIRKMADLLFDRIDRGGAVTLKTATVVDRNGKTTEVQVLLTGCFTAAYHLPGETGFLNYTTGGDNLYALSSLPPKAMQEKIDRYMAGEREAVPMDISRGGALRQLTHRLSLWDQIPQGGPIVWPILAILGLGGLITLERLFFLLRRKIRLETVCAAIQTRAESADWQGCKRLCDRYAGNPVIRVVRAGIRNRTLPREDMENAVQEAILREIPPMERFLSTMGMLAAIAPLLGLLGTVTGMIDTFHVITLHGTGDPRMMSGGISEALVTTMLGLSVAIPIMLSHTLLSRAVENTVGLMEEKAVALINIVQKTRGGLMGLRLPDILPDTLDPALDLIRAGGPVMVPLVVLSLVMWLLILERAFFFHRLNRRGLSAAQALSLVRENRMPEGKGSGIIGLLVAEFLLGRTGRKRLDRHIMDAAAGRLNRRLNRSLAVIGVLAAMAPLMGLLGTVTGMIATFDVLSIFGTGNAKAMAGGISEALITTQTGLIVAIPGLYMKGFLDRRAEQVSRRITRAGLYLKRHI